tara:strand:- start:197 stop:1045 length:849 start_codon:yes stop_codon:yes gene_type:complete
VEVVFERAHAKVNLALHVLARRDDGYHELDSLVVFASLCDQLRLRRGKEDQLRVEHGKTPIDGENLCMKALNLLRSLGHDVGPTAIDLVKTIPVAAGLGGGSADAAATLRGLNELWCLGIGDADMHDIALHLGADVPVCLNSKPARMRGIGEELTPLKLPGPGFILLVNDGRPVPTEEVFGKLAPICRGPMPLDAAGLMEWSELAHDHWRNDLERPAAEVNPHIADMIAKIGMMPGCIRAGLSGSGGTCFGLFGCHEDEMLAQAVLRLRTSNYWAVAGPIQL